MISFCVFALVFTYVGTKLLNFEIIQDKEGICGNMFVVMLGFMHRETGSMMIIVVCTHILKVKILLCTVSTPSLTKCSQ